MNLLRGFPVAFLLSALLGSVPVTVVGARADDRDRLQPARFSTELADGKVVRVVVRVERLRTSYVFDRFVSDTAALEREATDLSLRSGGESCARFSLDARSCARSCVWAEAARAFTRVTAIRDGMKSQVLLDDTSRPMRFNAGVGSNTGKSGDCVSPDGRYLSVIALIEGEVSRADPQIVELGRGLSTARFKGRQSQVIYAQSRGFDFVGWRGGTAHTLLFSYGGGDVPIDDEALPQ